MAACESKPMGRGQDLKRCSLAYDVTTWSYTALQQQVLCIEDLQYLKAELRHTQIGFVATTSMMHA